MLQKSLFWDLDHTDGRIVSSILMQHHTYDFFFQCVGRAIRGKTDYGIMVFADKVLKQPRELLTLAR